MNEDANLNQEQTISETTPENANPPERPSEVGPEPGATTSGINYLMREATAPGAPTIGRIVLYTLTDEDAQQVNRRRTTEASIAGRLSTDQWPLGAQAHIGNAVSAGDVFPAVVVHANGTYPNLKVLLDGTDELWKTSVPYSGGVGGWEWPTRS